MLRLRLLGTPEIEAGDNASATSLLNKPKRFALLAYLAAATPRGFHRRDTLLAIFWPEFDQQRARAALSRALYDLRQELPEGTIVTRGNDEIGIDRDHVWCDVVAFEDALAGGDPLGALDLYRGDLLSGFFITDAPEFEHWHERESTRLREAALKAALQLSATMWDGLRWARRARDIDPLDERALRNLLKALDSVGDRTTALREYENFARRLDDEFGVEPAPETRALIESIRSRENGVAPQTPTETPEPLTSDSTLSAPVESTATATESAPDPAPPLPPEPPAPASPAEAVPPQTASPVGFTRGAYRFVRRRFRRRHRITLLLGVILVAALTFQDSRLTVATTPGTVVILPFEYRGAPAFTFLGEAMTYLLAAEINRIPDLESVDPRIVLANIEAPDGEPRSPRYGRDLVHRLGARLFVLGDIVEIAGRLHLSAALYDDTGYRRARATANIDGELEEIFELVEEMTLPLFAGVARMDEKAARTAQKAARAALATQSLRALESFIYGEQALRQRRFDEALDQLQRAVSIDTTFAQALLRLSQAAYWIGADSLARSAADAVSRHSDRLTDRQRLFATGWRAYLYGAGATAERTFRALLASDSPDPDAWFYLGETLFQWGPTYGWSTEEASYAFDQVIALDPGNATAILQRGRLAAHEDMPELLDKLITWLDRLAPDDVRTLELRALHAWRTADTAGQRRIVAELRTLAHPALWRIALSITTHAGDPGAALMLVPLLRHADESSAGEPGAEIRARTFAAILEASRGRLRAADRWLDSVAAIDPARALEYRGVLAIQPVETLDYEGRDALRAELEDFDSSDAQRPTTPLDRVGRATLGGILAARAGNGPAFDHALNMLGEFTDDALGSSIHAQRAVTILRVEAARVAGLPETALQELARLPITADSIRPAFAVDYAKAHLRWLRAEIHELLGNDDAALRWYGTFPDPAGNDLIYLAPSHLRRARIYDRLGDKGLAARHYRRFFSLWRDADPALQPLVNEARLALTRLERGRPPQ